MNQTIQDPTLNYHINIEGWYKAFLSCDDMVDFTSHLNDRENEERARIAIKMMLHQLLGALSTPFAAIKQAQLILDAQLFDYRKQALMWWAVGIALLYKAESLANTKEEQPIMNMYNLTRLSQTDTETLLRNGSCPFSNE